MSSTESPNGPPAGWYPCGPNEQRYWDGAQWTPHTAPLAFSDTGTGAASTTGVATTTATASQVGSGDVGALTGPAAIAAVAAAGGFETARPRAEPDTSMAMLAHLVALFTGIIGPLIIYLVKRDDNQFARFHAAQALNFQISLILAWFVTFVLMFVIIGVFLLPVVLVFTFVCPIVGAVKAHRGSYWEYPLTVPLVK